MINTLKISPTTDSIECDVLYEVFTVVFGYYCIMCVKHTGTESQSESPAEGTRAASAGETGETFLNV